MMYLSSVGVIAHLMDINKSHEEEVYTSVTHHQSNLSISQRITFHRTGENPSDLLLMNVNEEENVRDALSKNSCKRYEVTESEFNKFFMNNDDLRIKILSICTRCPRGIGFDHCKFYDGDLYKKYNNKFFLNGNVRISKSCTKKNT